MAQKKTIRCDAEQFIHPLCSPCSLTRSLLSEQEADRIAVYEKDKVTRPITNAILLSHKGGNHWESASPITG